MPRNARSVAPKRQWAVTNVPRSLLPFGSAVRINMLSLVEGDLGSVLHDYTVQRVVGSLYFSRVVGGAFGGDWAAGIIQVTKTAGLGGTPNPTTEPHADWLWKDGGLSGLPGIPVRIVIDNRTSRRTRELERDWFMILDNPDTVDLNYRVVLRVLLRLAS